MPPNFLEAGFTGTNAMSCQPVCNAMINLKLPFLSAQQTESHLICGLGLGCERRGVLNYTSLDPVKVDSELDTSAFFLSGYPGDGHSFDICVFKLGNESSVAN